MAAFDDLVEQADRACMAALGGEFVTYTPAPPGPSVQVTGIFDAKYMLVKGDALAGVEATGPAIFFRLSDLPESMDDLEDDDSDPTITVRGVDYRVIERMPDDQGGIVLVLRKIT